MIPPGGDECEGTRLLACIKAAGLPNPTSVQEDLKREHRITTVDELSEVLSHPEHSQSIPTLWRMRFSTVIGSNQEASPVTRRPSSQGPTSAFSRDVMGGKELIRCRMPGSEILVLKGDITASTAEAIVNAANSQLLHGGGLAGAIVDKGGTSIQAESSDWIRRHSSLNVGTAMSTASGRLPCKYIIHAVGPNVSHAAQPTPEHAQQLRDAVWNALVEAARLGVQSVAIPGISTGIFGYPRDLGAREIVNECVRFCCENKSTSVRSIGLVNIDDPTVSCFVRALEDTGQLNNCTLELPPSRDFCSNENIRPPQNLAISENVWPSLKCYSMQDNSDDWTPDQSDAKTRSNRGHTAIHKAGGVLLARAGASGMEVLVGVEYRPMDKNPARYVNFLGGKIEYGECPVETAAREFSEEVGGNFTKNEMIQHLNDATKSIELWLPFAKYMLYISHWDVDERADNLPEMYARRRKGARGIGRGAEHDFLMWLSWDALIEAAKQNHGRVSTPWGKIPISSMICRFLARYQTTAAHTFNRLIVNKIMDSERARIRRLKSLSDADLISNLLRSDWKLSLTSPPMAPPSPIQVLQPNDSEYQRVLSTMPAEMSSNVVSVRRVKASARESEYISELKRIQATKASVGETEPLYHGTPERWRATAIALNGFDLSIKLVGRSYGDGVYSSPDINAAYHYSSTKTGGSLLHLRGIIASNCQSSSDNTILPGNGFHVFPNPRCVLPLLIVDFAAANSQDLDMERQAIQDDYNAMLEKRKAMETSMKVKEATFCREMAARLRRALNVYSKTFEEYEKSVKDTKTDTPVTPDETNQASLRRLLMERQQFAACLPMYEKKHELVDVLQHNQVVIITADTGSGKSTQLPQIFMDNILPHEKTRRIAVLQPRRVNAVSLSKRVAEERGLPHGQEIGYLIGRGESNVSDTTRVEYMTHGLFVQLAHDWKELLAKYCVVIVDEAHERSVDVDLSLALLKRALRQLRQLQQSESTSADIKFRVVVTSATIKEEAEHFRQYLDPSLTRSAIFAVTGCAFPVHIEHRSDVIVDQQIVGTAGVGKVLTSAAIQTAMDILRTTEAGNILIFLPGEGSINDALEMARQDILMASNSQEAKDARVVDSDTVFCFQLAVDVQRGDNEHSKRMFSRKKSISKMRNIKVCILAFHGKISRAQRDHVLNPPPDQRFVIFSTNVAETGVTLPNVRYVIDTGLEGRVRWNASVDVNEMVTEHVTQSSMTQRAGRAGRTASGICIRLFPEDQDLSSPSSAETSTRRSVEPAVQNSMIYKAVLLDKDLQRQNERLEMIDPINTSLFERAEARLHELGALDENGILTPEGGVLLSLGVDVRLGRFLIACSRFGCLATGAKLAALITASNGAERLLPDRKRLHLVTKFDEYIDPSGDHLTLLNIINGYYGAVEQQKAMKWCRGCGFDEEVFTSAEISYEYLLKVLDRLQFDLVDDADTVEQNNGIGSSIRRALCSAYFDQIAATRTPGIPTAGFTRILDSAKRNGALDMMTDFAGRTQPAASSSDKDSDPPEPIVKAGSYTTLWLDQVSQSKNVGRLVIFGSQMLTDGSQRAEPTVQLISYVTEEEVAAGAPEWCRLVDFKDLLQSSAQEIIRLELSDGVRRYVVMDRGAWLKQLRRKFPAATATVNRNTLVVTCPRRMSARVDFEVRKLLRVVEPEKVTLQLPDHVEMGKIIGKGGQNIKALEENIQELLSSEQGGVGRRHVENMRILDVNSSSREITITLVGEAKVLMPVIVGRIQSSIVQTHGDNMLPLVTRALGDHGQEMQHHPRLAQILNCVAPPSWQSRDDIMLQLAHALVWKCDVSIYGGFLRDWVVRGEPANDIDVQILPPQTTTASVQQQLQQHLAQTPGALQRQVQITSGRQKGSAFALAICADGISSIDIDLVDPSAVLQQTHPGVDCDAGNLLLNRQQSLRKKIPTAGDSLAAALENVGKKQFVFYYPLHSGAPAQSMAIKRLRKYLKRGWTCLSDVPSEVMQQLTDAERQLITPSNQGYGRISGLP
ncbi:hypothetical protein F444_09781 [Phytophthora nicotianae P1976]|uniref:Nudix hydrolase domain-containing protein n=1 Tax=Phytophthora nicotianae P1976 TaxID=1317066 RepID=A0A081A6C3_PHYNI|nr:hypothetical protein F444_09781 [Phytophthora nicotianae P1976]